MLFSEAGYETRYITLLLRYKLVRILMIDITTRQIDNVPSPVQTWLTLFHHKTCALLLQDPLGRNLHRDEHMYIIVYGEE